MTKNKTYSFILQKVFCVLGFFYVGLMWFHHQEVLTIGDAKDAFIAEEKAINFKGDDYNLT